LIVTSLDWAINWGRNVRITFCMPRILLRLPRLDLIRHIAV
jgi:hypothetical protein